MGGCASKPKESDIPPKSVPTEAPVSPKKEEAKTVAQESNVGESQKEAPLVDLSEPKEEAVEVETVSMEVKPEVVEVIPEAFVEGIPEAVVEAKSAEAVEAEKQEEPKVEVAAEAEQKVEVVAEAKEKVEVVAEAEEKVEIVPQAEEKVEAAAEKPKEQPVLEAPKEEKASDATPTPTTQESDAPLVTEA